MSTRSGVAGPAADPEEDPPLAIDVAFYAGFVRRGLLAYRIVSIFLSAVFVVAVLAGALLLIGVAISAASAQTDAARQAEIQDAVSLIQRAAVVTVIGVIVAVLFAFFRFAAVRFVMFLILVAPAFFQILLGGIKLTGLVRGLVSGRWEFDVYAEFVLLQGIVMVTGGALLVAVAGGLLVTLRLDRQTFRRVWRLGRAPLQIFSTPRWFYRLGPRSLIAVPVYVVINAVFCCAVAFLFATLYTSPITLNNSLARGMEAVEAGDHRSFGNALGEGIGFVLFAAGLAAGTGWLLRQGRKLGVSRATAFRQRDPRPPVLFLRSFRDDQVFLGNLRLASIPRMLSFETYPTNLDAMLAHEALAVGPPIALGNPHDRRQISGVARDWVADSAWQDRILTELDAAGKIFLVVDRTAGTLWEMDCILGNPDWLARTVFLKPPRSMSSESATPDAGSWPFTGTLSKLWAQPCVFGIEMGRRGPTKVFVSRHPDALEYQCLLREVMRPDP